LSPGDGIPPGDITTIVFPEAVFPAEASNAVRTTVEVSDYRFYFHLE
jgi:hypothetical protein